MSDDRPRISNEQAARERAYWIEQSKQPTTEQGRRNLARAQYHWAQATRDTGSKPAEPTSPEDEREIAELGGIRSAHARRKWPAGSEVYELQREMAMAARTAAEFQQRMKRDGWSQQLADEIEVWEARKRLAADRAVFAMRRDTTPNRAATTAAHREREGRASGQLRARRFLGTEDDR